MDIIQWIKDKLHNRRWHAAARSMASCGENSWADVGFSVISPSCISIGNHFLAGKNLKLQAWPTYHGKPTGFQPKLTIGNNVTLMDNCQISCLNEIFIDDGSSIGDNSFIIDNSHGKGTLSELDQSPMERALVSKGKIFIGKNVWIGRNVGVMAGVEIGDGAIIGANAVVTKSIPAGCIAAGVPAKVIRKIE